MLKISAFFLNTSRSSLKVFIDTLCNASAFVLAVSSCYRLVGKFDVCLTVHHWHNESRWPTRCNNNNILIFKLAQHVSGNSLPILRSARLWFTACGIMSPNCCRSEAWSAAAQTMCSVWGMLLEQYPSHRWMMDSKGCGRRRSWSFPMSYSVIGLRDGEKPRSLCQGGQCRGLAACRLDFVTFCCRPWLPYTTNVKSTSAVVFYQPVCFYLPICLCSLAGCLFLHNGSVSLLLSHIVCFISSLDRVDNNRIWLTHLLDFFSICRFLFDSTYIWN